MDMHKQKNYHLLQLDYYSLIDLVVKENMKIITVIQAIVILIIVIQVVQVLVVQVVLEVQVVQVIQATTTKNTVMLFHQ